jgi:hypothetical protein
MRHFIFVLDLYHVNICSEGDITRISMLLRIDSENQQAGTSDFCFDLNAPPAHASGVGSEAIVQEVCTRVDVQIDHEDALHRYV